jgi:hypothetical protein
MDPAAPTLTVENLCCSFLLLILRRWFIGARKSLYFGTNMANGAHEYVSDARGRLCVYKQQLHEPSSMSGVMKTVSFFLVIVGICLPSIDAQQACPALRAGTWSEWGPWNANCTECSSPSRYRQRICLPPQDGGCIAMDFNCE